MKTLLKVLGVIVVCIALLLVVLSITGFGPHGNTPGLWLKGNVVTTPVTDWSFTDKYETINVQTNTKYLLPHSVTTYCVSYDGQLYLTSVYRAGLTYPHGRSWNEDVARDPHVRIRIGDQLYDRTLSRVTDETLRQTVLAAKRKKYPQQKIPPTSTVILFHVLDN
ncbi:MAG TPA: hypothetical protein VK776_02150 [Bryobacteraceae bacterium]|jgi:hypothetical protein|nr:hypothetical protein [Bryobacteraceae bacterium]